MRVDLNLKEVLDAFPIGKGKNEKLEKSEQAKRTIRPLYSRDLDAAISLYLMKIGESDSPYERQGLLDELEQLVKIFGRQ